MNIAFLILTYKDLYHNELLNLIPHEDIYIHPKQIEGISDSNKKFIIDKDYILETKWGDMSIIHAIISLLTFAFSKKKYDYFVLLSEDTYPMMNKKEFNDFINDQNKLSCFEFIKEYNGLSKSYVWWMLNYKDAEIIIKTKDKYINLFDDKKIDGTFDESYFLTVLKKEIKDYKFNNNTIIYTRWLYNTILKHPFVFNKLTQYDIDQIKLIKAPFLRKTLKNFNPSVIKNKKKLLLSVIGENTDQKIICNLNDYDIIIICAKEFNDKLLDELKNNCLFIINITWDLLNENILTFIEEQKAFLNLYQEVLVSTEKYDFNFKNKYDLSKYPKKELLLDKNNNKAYLHITPIEDVLKFKIIKKLSEKRNNLISVSFFKMIQSYRDFGKYETYLKNFINKFPTLKDYNLRIYVDESTSDNYVLQEAKKYDFMEIVEFECKNFKIDKFHNGTFATLIRLYPLFNLKDDYEIIRVSDIDLQFNIYFQGREEYNMQKYKLNFFFLKYIPYIKPWSNPKYNHTIMGGLILSKVKFPRDIFNKYLDDLYLIENNKYNSELSMIVDKIRQSTNYKYKEKNIQLPYGIDELFLNHYLYPFIKTKSYIKYGMRAELYPSQILNLIKTSKILTKEDLDFIEKLKKEEEDIFFKRSKNEAKFLSTFMEFIKNFKNKISDQYDELYEEIMKYKNDFKGSFIFFLVPK